MEEWKHVMLDDESMWPSTVKVALPEANVDDRGVIQSLVNFPMKNISLISSKKGSVRANHHHVTDWHYMYVLKGSFEYYWRPSGSGMAPSTVCIGEGEMVFTPPGQDHATVFLEDTEMVVVSRNPRGDQASYESDVRRVVLVDPGTVVVP